MKYSVKKTLALVLCVLMTAALLCACVSEPQKPDDPTPPVPSGAEEKDPPVVKEDYSAEAASALTVLNSALDSSHYVLERTYDDGSYVRSVRSGKSVYAFSDSEYGKEETLWLYGTVTECPMYVHDYAEGIWKKYVTRSDQHEFNIKSLLSGYNATLNELINALDGAAPDSLGVYTLTLTDGSCTLWVKDGAVYVDGGSDAGLLAGKTVLSQVGTAEVPLTDEMLAAEEYEYVYSQN